MALDYPIFITPPQEVNLTKEQFEKLSVMGLQCCLITHKIIIKDDCDKVVLFCKESMGATLYDNPRFMKEDIKAFINEDCEMIYFHIPKTTNLFNTFNKRYLHKYLK